MRKLALLLILLTSACSSVQVSDAPLEVIIKHPINLDWGILDHGDLRYSHAGIPGNIATFPRTRTPQNTQLNAIVLGDQLISGERVAIHVLGSLEQLGESGLVNTIIASTDESMTLESLERDYSGALAVIESGLVQLNGDNARSLGYRPAARAEETILNSRY